MKVKKNFRLITLLALAAFCNVVSPQTESVPPQFEEALYSWMRTFAETMQIAHQKHYKLADPTKCMIEAIRAFVGCMDAHSDLLDPKTYKATLDMTRGDFFGIGVVIDNTRQPKDKMLIIIDTIPSGPADTAGVKPMDKIVEIDGKILEGMTTEEATNMLKGARNTKVHVKVLRENAPDILSFDITRDVIKEQNSMCFYLPEYNVYYLSLSMFTENSVKQLRTLLEQSAKKEYKGLILDLRNNSGGLLTAAVDIASLFLNKGSVVVVTKDKSGKEQERYETKQAPIAREQLPIFILINNFTASAAEILSGALKIHAQKAYSKQGKQRKIMTFLVGTRTFGKGSVQELIPVSNDCALKITTSLYFMADDSTPQVVGIEPDFTIERKLPPSSQTGWFTKLYGREKALDNHIVIDPDADKKEKEQKEQATKKNKDQRWTDRAQEMLTQDNQFRETLTLINLLSMAKKQCNVDVSTPEKAVKFLKSVYVTNEPITFEEIKE